MGYEFDFLPVGEGSSGGDAIAIRYGNLTGSRDEQTIIIIDGGYTACGEALVDLVQNTYNSDSVDIVVSTHPDQDHTSGLKVVLEELEVDQLWMHQPWNHSANMSALRKQAFNSVKLSERVEASLRSASDLEQIALRRGVPIYEPFAGTQTNDGVFSVVGPSEDYYEDLVQEILEGQTKFQAALTFAEQLAKKIKGLVLESLTDESLTDEGVVSPRNNSSVISLFAFDGRYSLFTGDAGIAALERAADELETLGLGAGDLRFTQVPHHGSKRNVGPTILNRLLGPKGQANRPNTAYISAPVDNPDGKHPADKVVNAYLRRGYEVYATQGGHKHHRYAAPSRDGFSTADPLPFTKHVTED